MNPLMNPVGSNAEGKLNCINAVVITQKTVTTDFLTHTHKRNEGEAPQFYVEKNHPAIVRPEVFEMVQEEFRRRKAAGGRDARASLSSPEGSYARTAAASTAERYGIPPPKNTEPTTGTATTSFRNAVPAKHLR